MAGVVAASENGFGLVGAARAVSLYVLKILPKSGGALTSNVTRAVDWAIAQKLDVVNCSFGGDTPVETRGRGSCARGVRTCSSSPRSGTGSLPRRLSIGGRRWSDRWVAAHRLVFEYRR